MENKINIAELLKDCPKGMELDCAMFEDVFFDEITNNKIFPICIKRIDGLPVILTKYGGYANCPSSKCVIFPKGKTTWEGFVPPCKFKDGDILFVKDICNWIFIYKESENKEDLYTYKYVATPDYPNYTHIVYDNSPLCCKEDVSKFRFATEEEKQKLFDAIKANSYKWNEESKSLEKLVEPKFKVGDKIRLKENRNYIYTITGIREKENKYECGVPFVLRFSEQDNWELVPNKFDINTLKPFDRVLTRDNDSQKWGAELFSFYDNETEDYHFQLVGIVSARYCIPYEGNEYLLGTTNDCDEFYKTWE